jgi:hypothetical protein
MPQIPGISSSARAFSAARLSPRGPLLTSEPLPSRATYAGIFCVALVTLMYEILLTRIFSVTMQYHFAFVALSLAMFGMTVGALAVYLAPRAFPAGRVREQLAVAGALFPLAIIFSSLTQLAIPFRVHPSVVAIYAIVLTYAVIAIPFIVSGIIVCLTLTRFPARVSALYGADLAGAAVGCVLLILVLDYSDAATAVLWIAWIASVGAIAYARDAGSRGRRSLTIAVAASIGVAAAAHTILVWRQFPVFRIIYVKGEFEARPLYEKWNSYSRVRVNGDVRAEGQPLGWGLSTALPPGIRVRQLQMDIDTAAGTVMTGFSGDLSQVEHLKYDVTNIGYYIRPGGDALVLGAGGGRDVLSALAFGVRSVTAVEINKDILRTVNGRFGDFTGHLDRDARVQFVNDEARSYVARHEGRFDSIQISLIDTWAATAAGAFVLTENSIYTVEAWTTFLRHLTDDGVLSVSRWYFADRPGEMYRATTLAVEALRRIGVESPRGHLIIVRNMHPANRKAEAPDGVGTLLVSRRPFTAGELDAIAATSARLGFDVALTPRQTSDVVFEQIASGEGLHDLLAAFPVNITAPTDDSPFFFNMLRLRDIARLDLLDSGKQAHNMKAVAMLGVLLLTVTFLTAMCILLPLGVAGRRVDMRQAGPLFTFFIAIGLAFMLIETALMQRLIIALGHPTYGLSVVLFAILLASGAGSYLTSGIAPEGLVHAGYRRLAGLLVVLAIFGAATPAVARWAESATTAVRIIGAVAILFPAGLVMGMAFPLGMKLASRHRADLTPWLWGLNGAASVLASVLSVCLALTWSISTSFWVGWTCYAAAAVSFSVAARRFAAIPHVQARAANQ